MNHPAYDLQEKRAENSDRAAAQAPKLCTVCATPIVAPAAAPKTGYVACANCNLLINFPFPTTQEIQDYYAEKASHGNYETTPPPSYEALRKDGYKAVLQLVLDASRINLKDEPVLDVGCFNGLSLEAISEDGGEPYGIEMQPEAAAVASSKFPNRVLQRDICDELKFEHLFRLVTMKDVIEHLADPRGALEATSRLMQKNGYLVITTPNTASLAAKLLGGNWPSYTPVHHLHLFNMKNLKMLVEECGFEVVASRSHWKWFSLEYVIWLMPNFNQKLAKMLALIPKPLRKIVLPLNGGEMAIVAKKIK